MYGIKMTCYYADKTEPREKIHTSYFDSRKKAEEVAHNLALMECDELNEDGNVNGNYFEVGEYKEIYSADGENCVCFPIAVLWYDKAPDDRENDCQIRVVTGYEIFKA